MLNRDILRGGAPEVLSSEPLCVLGQLGQARDAESLVSSPVGRVGAIDTGTPSS